MSPAVSDPALSVPPLNGHSEPSHVVALGASAGGIGALRQFFDVMPPDSGMAFIVVLHLSPDHESQLASILQSETTMQVKTVRGPLPLLANVVYVNSPESHITVVDKQVSPVAPEPQNGRRVPIDLLFRTLGEAYCERAICVVLSGTGADGTLGIKRVKESGGIAIAQDPNDAEYDAMPRSAIGTDLVDIVLPIEEMPARIIALGMERAGASSNGSPSDAETERHVLAEILETLHERSGHDFNGYKQATLLRRITRRITVNELVDLTEYRDFLRNTPAETNALLRDLLISVTNFFRDTEAFAQLETTVIPALFAGKSGADVVRVWVAACATGEEAYTVAMLLAERASMLNDPPSFQVFASDIDGPAIAIAREGRYNDTIALDVDDARLERFFIREGEHYRVKKPLRETILFARHNLLADPPFSHLDLITCRNLLIYLDRDAQAFAIRIMQFALVQGGYLMLGASESAESSSQQFTVVDRLQRIYRSTGRDARSHPMSPSGRGGILPGLAVETAGTTARPKAPFGQIHHRLVEGYAPPSLVVDENLDLVHVSERCGRYLHFAGGDATGNVLQLVLRPLRSHLRDAISEARHTGHQAVVRGIVTDGDAHAVDIIVRPFEPLEGIRGYTLVMFEESSLRTESRVAPSEPVDGSYVLRLEEELQQAREQLRARSELSENAEHELRSSNEELHSMIEELRSAAEEVETSKEELTSVNEELSTVNQELKCKIEEVSIANADLQNLLAATDIATIFLDEWLRIRRYTPLATSLFNLIETDVGRPLAHLTHRLDYDELVADAAKVIETLETIDREVRADTGGTYIARLVPYHTLAGRSEGVVLTFIDITERKAGEETCEWLSAIVSSSNDAIISFNLDGSVKSWNGSAERLFGYSSEEIVGRSLEVLSAPSRAGEIREIIGRIARGETVQNYETERKRKNGELLQISMSISPIQQGGSAMRGLTAIVQDVTGKSRDRAELALLARRKDEFLAMLSHELRNPLAPILSGVEALRVGAGDPELVEMAAGIIERQTNQMVRLVNDLLDVSRIANGTIRLQKETVTLQSLVTAAMETCSAQLGASQQVCTTVLPPEPIHLEVDPARVTQVIVNLLNNAGKYTETGGTIVLTATLDGPEVVMSLSDTGIGIAPEMLERIFDMFSQVENGRHRQRGGLGVGLSLVRTLVEMHGGTVTAHSEGEGMGSEFTLRLPIVDAPARSDGSEPPVTAHVDPDASRILVVDDNADAARLLGELLTSREHEVRVAHDGASALVLADEFRPQVCVLDIGLPDIDGYEVARAIRASHPYTLLIALTGWGQDEDRRRSREAGFDYHIVKPAEAAMILAHIAAGRPA